MLNFILGKRKKGIALVIVLVVFAVVAIVGTTILTISFYQSKQTSHRVAYEKAYYLARSGVEVVAKDLTEHIDNLTVLKTQLESTTNIAEYNAKLAEYQEALKFITDNYIDKTITLTNGNGYVSDVVRISNDSSIYIESEKTIDGATAKAKLNLATSSIGSSHATIISSTSVTPGTDALFSWGNINMGNGGTITGDISYVGSLDLGNGSGNETIVTGGPPKKVNVNDYPIHIQAPPQNIWDNTSTPPEITQKPTTDADGSIRTSGYYNADYGNIGFQWTVDTTVSDVTLVFDHILANQDSSITIIGTHNLYIYLLGDTSTTLMDLQNKFTITNDDTTDKKPHTYITSYDRNMRGLNNPVVNTSIFIKNGPDIQAFFYAPYTDTTIQNNTTFYGSLYAGNITMDNNSIIKYYKSTDENFGGNKVTTTTVDTPFNYNQFTINNNWVK